MKFAINVFAFLLICCELSFTALVPEAFANMPLGVNAHAVFYQGRLLYFSFVTLNQRRVRGHCAAAPGSVQPRHPGSSHRSAVPAHPAGPARVLGAGRAACSLMNRWRSWRSRLMLLPSSLVP